jgi:hypothetical protein
MGLFSLIAKLGLDTTAFEVGAKRAESVTTKLASSVKSNLVGSLGAAFTVGAISSWTKHVIDAADHIGDLAEQTSESTDNIQRLQILANKSGVEVEKYTMGLLKMGEARKNALAGDQKSIQLLESFGLAMADLRGNASNLDLLTRVGEAFSKNPGNLAMQANLADLLGEKMSKVGATIGGINDLGPVKLISEQDIKDLSALNDQLDELGRNLVRVSAPAAGFWARVLKRADGMDEDGLSLFDPSFTKATFQETMDSWENPDPTGPLTPDEIAASRSKLKGTDKQKSVAEQMAEDKAATEKAAAEYDNVLRYAKLKKELRKVGEGNQFGFDSAASGGGHYFGSNATASLGGAIKETGNQVAELNEQLKDLRSILGPLARP